MHDNRDYWDTSTTVYAYTGVYSAPKPFPTPDHSEALEKRLHCRVGWQHRRSCRPARAGRAKGIRSREGRQKKR